MLRRFFLLIIGLHFVFPTGNAVGIYDIIIKNNKLLATGNGNRGCITYRGTGSIVIEGNAIVSKRGITILSTDCNALIKRNIINSSDYSIQALCSVFTVVDNQLQDGLICSAKDICIKNNKISLFAHPSSLGKDWRKVIIEKNEIQGNEGNTIQSAFLLDATDKTASFDMTGVKVRKNMDKTSRVREVVSVTGAKKAPQLRMIKNIK